MNRRVRDDVIMCCLGLAAAVLGGCAMPQSAIEDADFGPPPVGYEQHIIDYFDAILIDPESARYEFETPYKAGTYRGLLAGGGWIFGWAVDMTVNSKNRMGGYVGRQRNTFFFHDGDRMTRDRFDRVQRVE